MSPEVEALVVQITRDYPLTDAEMRDVLAAQTPDDVALLASVLEAAGRGPDRTAWQAIGAAFEALGPIAVEAVPLIQFVASLA